MKEAGLSTFLREECTVSPRQHQSPSQLTTMKIHTLLPPRHPHHLLKTSSLCWQVDVSKLLLVLDVTSRKNSLSDSSADLNSLDRYPNIRKLFITLNTGLPASAAVERLFSLGGRVFSLLRAKLSSEHFEMMLFYAVQISES